ncbi:MAG: tetratricopeptide repeat protein [Acidobacteria bacterium]|nr:tetratricopeptide repeat protein [Acidobacteriota bacterium]
MTGTTVGRFAVRARLGAGGMGEVYRADDTKLKRPVALKRIAPQIGTLEHYRRRFLKEAQRASSLSYDHIAGVYDVLEEKGEIFLVMEYVEGQTLRQRLGEPLAVDAFLPIALQCAAALVAAHGQGIAHGDIKPENIMVTTGGQVKVLDFGVAKLLPRARDTAPTESIDTGYTGFSGTLAYAAPEVLQEQEADERADIFSLGVVFYEALTGRHPFRASSPLVTSDRIQHETPTPPSALNSPVSPDLDRIVAKMLEKNPADRYATAADLLVDLRALERGLTLAPAPRLLPHPRPRRRWVLAAAVVAVLAVLLAAGAAWKFWPRPAAERIRVAVAPFANNTGDEQLEKYRLPLTHMLLLDLTGSPNIHVFPYERLLEITQGLEEQGVDVSSAEAIQSLGVYSNAQFVIVPSMHSLGSTLRLSAEFRYAHSGETRGAVKVERLVARTPEDTLHGMLGELTDQIEKHFKDASGGEDYRPRPPGSRPKTAVAALHLNAGRTAFAQGQYAQALESFQQVVKEDPQFALAYAWMGQIHGILGYDDKARELSQKAAQLIKPDTPLGDAYFIEANLAERRYDYSAAEQKYLELIRLYPDEAVWHVRLAEVYEKQGQYPKAIASYQGALRLDPNYILVDQELGVLYTRTDNLPQALPHAQKALSRYQALGNQEGEASALAVLGEVYRLQSDYAQASRGAQSSLELSQKLKHEYGVVRASKLLGDIRFSEGNYREARRYYQQVLSASSEIRNNRWVVLALMNTGVTYHREGELAKAVEYYERSLSQGQLYGEYKDWPALRGRAMALSNLGSILIAYGPDSERGQQLVQEALLVFQMMGNSWWEARATAVLGLFHMNAGRYSQSVDYFQKAQTLYASIQDKEGRAYALYMLGRCYFAQNQYEQARALYTEALSLAEDAQDHFRRADSQIHLGWTYHRLGDAAQARRLLQEGFEAVKKNGFGELLPDALNASGELYRERDARERARESFQQASSLWKDPHVSDLSMEARSNLGLLEAERGNLAGGLALCRQPVERARQLRWVHTLARALINVARIQLLQGQQGNALEALDEINAFGGDDLGLELRAQALYLRSRALEGLGKSQEAAAAYQEGQAAVRQLQATLSPAHRESFARRSEIRVLLR